MFRHFSPFILVQLFGLSLMAQVRVVDSMPIIYFSDDFNENSGKWPMVTTVENYFVVDKGEYFMNRNSEQSPYAVMANFPNNLSVFHIESSVRLGPVEEKEQTIGLIFMSQAGSNSAMVFEINGFGRFRVKKIKDGYIGFYSGGVGTKDGWEKFNYIEDPGVDNVLEVKHRSGNYDVFINSNHVMSYYDPDFKTGDMGFFIGAKTKARIDRFYVRGPAVDSTAVACETCEQEKKQLEQENAQLQEQLAQRMDAQLIELQGVIQLLEGQLMESNKENELLRKEISQYEELRFLLGNVDRDIILTLSRNLKSEMNENQRLQLEIRMLNDSISTLHQEYDSFRLDVLEKIENGTYLIEEPEYEKAIETDPVLQEKDAAEEEQPARQPRKAKKKE